MERAGILGRTRLQRTLEADLVESEVVTEVAVDIAQDSAEAWRDVVPGTAFCTRPGQKCYP